MKENLRKCLKCGRSPASDPDIKLRRFPRPGSKNSLCCESWARYCYPNLNWSSREFHEKLHKEHRMLCNRHFKPFLFIRNKLVRYAVPDEECDEMASPNVNELTVEPEKPPHLSTTRLQSPQLNTWRKNDNGILERLNKTPKVDDFCKRRRPAYDIYYPPRSRRTSPQHILRARAWAEYCWSEKDWTSADALTQLFKSNKVLCKRHFEDHCFTDSSKKNLGKFSVPNKESDAVQSMEISTNETALDQQSADVPKVQNVHKQSEQLINFEEEPEDCVKIDLSLEKQLIFKPSLSSDWQPGPSSTHSNPASKPLTKKKTGIESNVKEKETKKNDILQTAITQADVPLTLADPLNVVQEYAMDVDDGDQHVGVDHTVEISSEEQKKSTPDYNAFSDSDDDYHPSKDEFDDDDEQSDDDEVDLPAQSALSINKPIAKHTATLPTVKHTANLPTVKHTANLPTVKHTATLPTVKHIANLPTVKHIANLPTVKYTSNTKIQATDSKLTDKESHTTSSVLRKRTYGKDTIVKQYGPCRCCLKRDIYRVVNVWNMLECLNIKVSRDLRVSLLLCSECENFLKEARKFRDMVAASQRTLLSDIHALDPSGNIDEKASTVMLELGNYEDVIIPGSTIYLSQDQAMHGSAKKKRILVINPPSNATTRLQEGYVKQGGMTMEQPDMAGEASGAIPMEQMPEEKHEDRAFSQLSDYTDFGMDKEISENMSTVDIDNLVKSMKKERAKYSCSMRENLITLLECSTIIPFATSKGVPFDCIYCDANYKQFHELRDHVEENHKYEENSFKHETLKIIPQTIIRADVSCIKCRLCEEQFTTIDNLVEHLVNIHNKKYHNLTLDPPHNILAFDFSLDDWQCLDCKKIFPTFKQLRAHVNKHYGSFLCHQCGSKFLYPNAYSKHMKDHQKVIHTKSNSCDMCGETFNYKKDLMCHKNSAHYDDRLTAMGSKMKVPFIPPDETPGEVYECVLCNKGMSFTTKIAAYMHRIGHLNNTREGPFNCEICEYSSAQKNYFKTHIQSHYGVINHVCEICNKGFRKKVQLSDHMATHLDLKFQCPLCDTTLSKKHVRRHVKNKHPDVTVQFAI